MDCSVPTSDIIPAVAARLKYYIDVERKEAAFDLSINQKDSDKKYRLYQLAGGRALHQTQRIKKNFLDNKMKASLQTYTEKSGVEWNQKVKINQEQKQQVQRKIKRKMSSLTIPDRFSGNRVHLRSINWKCSDWEDFSPGPSHSSPPDISHGEFRRLVASAANLILATTPVCPCQCSHQCRTEGGFKRGVLQSHPLLCVTIPSSCQEHCSNTETSPLSEGSHTHCDESVDLGVKKIQTVPATSENIDYEIVINRGATYPTEAKPSLVIQLVGENGRSKTLVLQNSLAKSTTSCAGQAATFHVETRDVGELKHVIMEVDRKRKDCRCYCRNITVKKGAAEYVFPCNKWLSPFRTVVAHATELVSTANVIPATAAKVSDAENCHTRKKQIRQSVTDTKLHDCRSTSPLITSKGLDISSCTHAEQGETAKKVSPGKLDVSKRNVIKSTASHRRSDSKDSQRRAIRKHGSPERKPQNVSSSKGVPGVSSGNTDGTSKNKSDQVTMVEVTPSNPISEDGSTRPSPLSENLDNVITKNTAGNLQTQNNIQTDGLTTPKYRTASSPASYVFFSRESEESPVIVKVNEHAKNNTSSGLTYGESIRASYDGMKQSVQYSFSDNRKEEIDDRASQLLILQQLLLESEDNLTTVSPRPASQPLSNCLNNAEATVDHGTKADEDNEVHSALLDSETAQTSGYCCSCEDHCSYGSDSMLDEDYLFFDTSLELSLSEDEDSKTPSKFGNLGNEAEENNEEQDRKKAASQDIYRERRMDSCSENLNIFQSSLAAILCHDNITLRNLCLSHLFISSFTDEEGKTLLHHAASQEDTIICQVLLDTTVGMVNIDQQDMFGKTALHYAVQNGNTKTIKLLLDNGAKLEIPDENSKTVLDIGLWKIQAK